MTAPARLRLGGEPTRFELVGAQIGANGATVTKQLGAPVPADQQGSLAYFDQTARAWVAVPTVVSADRRQLTAQTAHFSIWDDIYYDIGTLITKRADAPSCSGATPSWVRDTTFFDDLNAPLQWCASRDPKNPHWLVVKVVASRAYGFLVRPAVTPQWTYSSFLHDVPGAADLISAGIDQTLRLPDLLQPMDGGVFLAPGAEVDFGFTEQQVRSLKTSELVSADPSITWMLAGSMYSAVSAVTGKDNAKFAYAYSLVAALQCAHDLVKANSALERSTAFVTCLTSNAKDIYSAALDLAAKAGMDTKAAAKKIPAVAAVSLGVAAATVGAQIGEWLSDQALPPASRALSVSLKALPPTPDPGASPKPVGPVDCGTVTTADSRTSPSSVMVRVIQGDTTCGVALSIAQSYFRELLAGQGEGSGAFLTVNGWLCMSNPYEMAMQSHHMGGCSKGDNQIGMDPLPGSPFF